MKNETMKNEAMNKLIRRTTVLLLTAYCLLLTVLTAAAQEDPLEHATLLPGAVGWVLVVVAIVLIIGMARWMRQR